MAEKNIYVDLNLNDQEIRKVDARCCNRDADLIRARLGRVDFLDHHGSRAALRALADYVVERES